MSRKPLKKAKAPKKGKAAKPRSKTFVLALIAVGSLVVVAQAWFFLRANNPAHSDFPVQVVTEFGGSDRPYGPFRAWDMVAAPSGGFALTDPSNNRILVLDREGGLQLEITQEQAGKPPFRELSCLTYDTDGNLWAMDAWNGLIRMFGPKGRPGTQVDLQHKGFYGSRGLAWDQGDIIVADTGSHRLVRISTEGEVLQAWGKRGSGRGEFINPAQVIVGPGRLYYAADRDNSRIHCVDHNGKFVREFKLGHPPGSETIDPENKRLYVAVSGTDSIQAFSLDGKYLGDLVTANGQKVHNASALCVLPGGDLAANHNDRIVIYRHAPLGGS